MLLTTNSEIITQIIHLIYNRKNQENMTYFSVEYPIYVFAGLQYLLL